MDIGFHGCLPGMLWEKSGMVSSKAPSRNRAPTAMPTVRSGRRRAMPCLLALLLAAGAALPVLAAEPGTALGQRLATVETALRNAGLAEDANAANTALIESIRDDLRLAGAAREAAQAFAAEATEAPRTVARIERELAVDPAAAFDSWRRALPVESVSALDERMAAARAQLEQLRQQLARSDQALGASITRPVELIEAATVERARLAELERAAEAARRAAQGTPGVQADLRVLAADAAVDRARAELERFDRERESLPVRQRLYELERRSIERQVALGERKLAALAERLAARRIAEAEALRAQVEDTLAALGDVPPALGRLVADSRSLAAQLVEATTQAVQSQSDAEAAARAASIANRALRNTQSRLALGGGNEALGLVLLEERRQLVDPKRLQRHIDTLRERLMGAQLDQIALDERRTALEDPDRIARLHDGDDSADATDAERQRAAADALLGLQARLLPALQDANRRLVIALSQQEKDLVGQLAASQALERLLQRRLLWMRSHPPVDRGWLESQLGGWADLLKPQRFATAFGVALRTLDTHAPQAALLALGLLGTLAARLRLRRRSAAIAPLLKRVRLDRFRHTMEILALTLLAAATVPLAVAGIGWLLQQGGEPGRFSDSLGAALRALAPLLFIATLCGLLARDTGLALHLRWTRARRRWMGLLQRWLLLVLAPLQLIATLAFARNQEPALATAGRDAMLLWCLAVAALLWAALQPGALWSPRHGAHEPVRLRQLLRVGLTGAALVMAVLVLDGYLLTALAFGQAMIHSALALLGIALGRGALERWMVLGDRRLALRRLAARNDAEADSGAVDAQGQPVVEPDADQLDRESINQQTRRLLRSATLGAVVLALLVTWSELLPALQRLDDIGLWSIEAIGPDGRPGLDTITLQDLAFGLIVLFLTGVAARNLPGLLELALLSRIHIDAPTRYAVSTLLRYVIVIGGLIAGLGLMGVRWGQLQWMAAALTVGLGFGLQEIFANFVSGIIVLFERPYRVGDIVTIGEVEGTVTRIRTRATTILDWDNKEVVVPNRMFITERFVNWTLSDAVTRVVVPVGVAYGSDVDQVRALLLQIAREEPLVLDSPAPTAWFMAFGPSSLDFELRVFVEQIIDRNRARTRMMTRMTTLFAQHGIEIAFPQLDLHVRHVNPLGTTPPEPGPAAPAAG